MTAVDNSSPAPVRYAALCVLPARECKAGSPNKISCGRIP
jgi:hypothetical protein